MKDHYYEGKEIVMPVPGYAAERVMNEDGTIKDEVEDWCFDNTPRCRFGKYAGESRYFFAFYNKRDAALFKLFWY